MRLQLLITILIGTLIMPPVLNCSTFEQSITLGVGEEYNSNVNDKSEAKEDWVSVATAKGDVKYESARVNANATIDGSYNYYALGNRTNEFKGNAQAKATFAVLQDTFFIEGEEKFQQVYTNQARGATNSMDSTRDQTNQNTVTGRAYITPRLSDRLATKLGYEYSAVIYNSTIPNKQINTIFSSASYELTPTLQLLVDADGRIEESQTSWQEGVRVSSGFRWQYSENGVFQVKAGPRFIRYNIGDFVVNPYWDATWSHSFGRFQVTGDSSSVYTQNPSSNYSSRNTSVGATLALNYDRGSIQARSRYSYLDGIGTQPSQQVSLGISTSYSLTDRLKVSAGGSCEYSLNSQGLQTSNGNPSSLSSQTNQTAQTRWYADTSLSYELGDKFFVEGYCKLKLSTGSSSTSNYNTNIVGIQIKKTF
jgi:hypothetical protein